MSIHIRSPFGNDKIFKVALLLMLTFVLLTINILNGSGRFLWISDFCSPNSEARIPISDFRISQRLDLQMSRLWFLDF